ncbi:serine protease inhibitor [Anopheles darlingi]|uniref:Serine protease inhibitor n=1 Tax=Anopheles darlingi TaxID=43151 RepID=W5JMV8_ANODA|nr:serine protease inhibitor [Anopheles darlingi]
MDFHLASGNRNRWRSGLLCATTVCILLQTGNCSPQQQGIGSLDVNAFFNPPNSQSPYYPPQNFYINGAHEVLKSRVDVSENIHFPAQETNQPQHQPDPLPSRNQPLSATAQRGQLQAFRQQTDRPNGAGGSGALKFAWSMLKAVLLPQSGNSVICPILPQTLLASLNDVASPQARRELQSALFASPDELKPLIQTQLKAVNRSSENLLDYAMTYITGKDLTINREVREKAMQDGVEFQNVDFRNAQAAAATANQWVSTKTRGVIREILSPVSLDGSTRLVMASVIYFKGKWKYQFTQTKNEPFFARPNQSPVQVPMMYQFNKFRTGEIALPGNDGIRWLELPYEGTNGLSMVVMLPQAPYQLERSINQMGEAHLNEIMEDINVPRAVTKVHLRLPRFEVYSSVTLVPTLKNLGLREIFLNNQALRGLSNEPLVVDDVTQRTFISVDEEGTTATSAASLSFVALSAAPPPVTINFTVDQPFVVMIVDKINRYPMFVAKVELPA